MAKNIYIKLDDELKKLPGLLDGLIEYTNEIGIVAFNQNGDDYIFNERNLTPEDSYLVLDRMFGITTNWVGMILLDDKDSEEVSIEFGRKTLACDFKQSFYKEQKKYEEANKILKDGIVLAIKTYDNIQKIDDQSIVR